MTAEAGRARYETRWNAERQGYGVWDWRAGGWVDCPLYPLESLARRAAEVLNRGVDPGRATRRRWGEEWTLPGRD